MPNIRRPRNPLNHVKIIQYGVSDGAKLLRDKLGIRRLVRQPNQILPNWRLLSWGNSNFQDIPGRVINQPSAVAVGKNKLRTFQVLQRSGNVNIPDFTTEIDVARGWARSGIVVVQRATLTGKAGEGITIVEKELDITRNLMYTKYIKKSQEWRIHVAFGEVIDFAKKIKTRDGIITGDARVRSHLNGYVFSKNREVVGTPRQQIMDQAIAATRALGLDFAGVDVIWNDHQQKAYVLELNTAPGIEGSTVDAYARAFRKHFGV